MRLQWSGTISGVLERARVRWTEVPLFVKIVIVGLVAVAITSLVISARGNSDYDACHRVYALMDKGIRSGAEFDDLYTRCTGIHRH